MDRPSSEGILLIFFLGAGGVEREGEDSFGLLSELLFSVFRLDPLGEARLFLLKPGESLEAVISPLAVVE